MSAFKKAWDILKEDDDMPNEDFHRLNDPNPTVAFGASLRNNPRIMSMLERDQEGYSTPYSEGGFIHQCKNCGKETDINYNDVQSDDFCSQRCAEGKDPTCEQLTGNKCRYVIVEQPEHNREISNYYEEPHYSISMQCPTCNHQLAGTVSE